MLKELNVADAYALEENQGVARLYLLSSRQWVEPAYEGYSVLDYHAASGRMLLLSPWVEKRGTLKAHLVLCGRDGRVVFATEDYLVSHARIALDGQAILVEAVQKPLLWIRLDSPRTRVNTGIDAALSHCVQDGAGCWLCPAHKGKGLVFKFEEQSGKCVQRVLPGVDKIAHLLVNARKEWFVLDTRGQLRKFLDEKPLWSVKLPPEKVPQRSGYAPIFWLDTDQRILYNYCDETSNRLHVLFIQGSDGTVGATGEFSYADAQGTIVAVYGNGTAITVAKKIVDFRQHTVYAADF